MTLPCPVSFAAIGWLYGHTPMTNRREPFLLFLVDVGLFAAALWLTLLLRYLAPPTLGAFYNHLAPFSFLFALWVVVFFVAGLYDKHTALFRSRMPLTILNAQAVNIVIAVLFFFFVPNVGVTPKASLAIYLIVSSALILLWRLSLFPRLAGRRKQRALLVGSGEEILELRREVDADPHYPFFFTGIVEPGTLAPAALTALVGELVRAEKAGLLVLDLRHHAVASALPALSALGLSGVRVLDAVPLFEEVFDREPLTLLDHRWLVENVSTAPQAGYDFGKRVIDLTASLALGAVSLILFPFVALAVWLDDGGPVFVFQKRVGKGGSPFRIVKFRSMRVGERERVTRVGRILRATRIDELPQLWSVLRGEQSLIGPRPELPEYVALYAKEIPYYHIRHTIKPGLSGWAQIQNMVPPKFGPQFDATRLKLSYDLYYVRHRSLWLDIKIALKTIKTLLSRSGI